MKQDRRHDVLAAARARRHGMRHSLKIAQEARLAGVPYDLAYALVEQETGTGRNVFGHDPTIYAGAGRVTKRRYLAYRRLRRESGNTLMQGVGLTQLTWWEFQDEADRHGGCWKPRVQLRVAFRRLRGLLGRGESAGIAAYNGSGPAATTYSVSVRSRRRKWHRRLNP